MEELDQCIDDLLDAVLTLEKNRKDRRQDFDREEHHRLAKKAASESVVMLKNEEKPFPLLPLQENVTVAFDWRFRFRSTLSGAGLHPW